MIPVANVHARSDDHVWNEFTHEDRWGSYSMYRSDSSGVIDYEKMISDNWATVVWHRGDGYTENATTRYGPFMTVSVRVTEWSLDAKYSTNHDPIRPAPPMTATLTGDHPSDP